MSIISISSSTILPSISSKVSLRTIIFIVLSREPNVLFQRISAYFKNNQYFSLSPNKISIYFLYPLTSFPEQEVHTSIEQNRFLVLKPCVGPPLFSVINLHINQEFIWIGLGNRNRQNFTPKNRSFSRGRN